MKMMLVSFLVIGFFTPGLMAQTPTGVTQDMPTMRPQEMPQAPQQAPQQVEVSPNVKNENPAQKALEAVLNEQDLQNGVKQITNSLGDRDPFQRPKYIDDLESDLIKNANIDTTEDDRVEAIRRWPLRAYKAIAIMWDIQNPKVMVVDPKGTLHLLKKNYRMGNRNGMITAINEGEIIVTESSIPVVIKIEASSTK